MSSNVFQWTTAVKTWTNDLFIQINHLLAMKSSRFQNNETLFPKSPI